MSTDPILLGELASIPVSKLTGVGPKKLKALESMEISSVLDLLQHYPRRYIDRTKQARIADLTVGDEAMVLGTISQMTSRRVRGGRMMVNAEVNDGSGRMKITFFNQPWRERQLPVGTEAVFFGKLEDFRGRFQMTNPIVDLIGDRTGRIVPVYPQSEKSGIASWELAGLAAQALRRCDQRGIAEVLPADVVERFTLCERHKALVGIHTPETMADVGAARKRLVFDELIRLQVALVKRKRLLEATSKGIVHAPPYPLMESYHAALPFPLTGAQRRSIEESVEDLAGPIPMHRLLQGDVGAGKTVVAVSSMLCAVGGGFQGALMAPTEVLAEQHYLGLTRDLAGLSVADSTSLFPERPLRVGLLTNGVTGAARKETLAQLKSGEIDIMVGTHALIQESVEFHQLGVVVVDEQHRFGVEQRAVLREANADGRAPDVLVMTATPIPRTAAMTVYGDLDVSVLDELPPGRTPIVTTWAQSDAEEDAAFELVRTEVASGRQAYIVAPLIDESEKMEVTSATELYERLQAVDLADLRLQLLHGRMTSAEKEDIMTRFRAGEIDALVSTTVIEVGVDVPNATVMVISDADRFGIAQLHQLRGRVGRGAHASHCVLIATEPTPDGEARLEALVRSTDGFELAEVDLDLRGEGTIMGERQKGRNDLKLASLRRDREWVEKARDAAFGIVGDGSGLDRYPNLVAEIDLLLHSEEEDFLFKG